MLSLYEGDALNMYCSVAPLPDISTSHRRYIWLTIKTIESIMSHCDGLEQHIDAMSSITLAFILASHECWIVEWGQKVWVLVG